MIFVKICMLCLMMVTFFVPEGATYATSILTDPIIPDGEKITYAFCRGDESSTVVEEVKIKKDGDKFIYEIISTSKFQDRKIQLFKETMAIVSIHTIKKFPSITIDSMMTVVDERRETEVDEMKLADFSVLTHVLRGFPFTKREKLKIGYFGEQKKNSYSMSVKCKGRDKVTIKSGTYDCYKLEFGMDGFFGTFLPKMNAWYSVDTPHYLVYYEGPDGPPGTPKRVMELLRYTKPSP